MQDKLEPRCLNQNSYGRSSVNVDSVEDVDQLERFARGTQNDSNVSPVDHTGSDKATAAMSHGLRSSNNSASVGGLSPPQKLETK